MHKLNIVLFYQFGKAMRTVVRRENEKPSQTFKNLEKPIEYLESFLNEIAYVSCPNTRNAADELMQYCFEIYFAAADRLHKDQTASVMNSYVVNKMKALLTKFEKEFDHDSREINVLAVPDRCAYSTTILIERGEDLLPESVKGAISDYARNEIHEAGKCLAFNVSTAAGFHLMRGVESVLRSYYDALSGLNPRPTHRNGSYAAMGTFITEVERFSADPKVIETLKQITRLHRNPLSHPDDVLSDEDAVVLTGVVVSAITGMVNDAKAKGHASLN